jgi:hypothetical protein
MLEAQLRLVSFLGCRGKVSNGPIALRATSVHGRSQAEHSQAHADCCSLILCGMWNLAPFPNSRA